MKLWRDYLFAFVIALAVLGFALIMSIQIVAFSPNTYRYHFKKSESDIVISTGLSYDELIAVSDTLVKYIKGVSPTLDVSLGASDELVEVFSADEKTHLKDIRAIYANLRLLRYLCFFVLMLSLILVNHKFFKPVLLKVLKIIPALFVAFIGIATLFAFNFSDSFIRLHELIFSNELWYLDPSKDLLVQMFPEQFFYWMILAVIAISMLFLAFVEFAYYLNYRRLDRIK